MSNAQYTEVDVDEFITEFGELALGNAQPVFTEINTTTHNVDVIFNFTQYIDSFSSTNVRNNEISAHGKPSAFPNIARSCRLNIRGTNYYISDFVNDKLTGFMVMYLSKQPA